uniref:BZIP domain-containing protein n=1 Tax=Heterorhabditis bacteriophora TaxID=37862 RepID=A0A1I7XFN2_HETBA
MFANSNNVDQQQFYEESGHQSVIVRQQQPDLPDEPPEEGGYPAGPSPYYGAMGGAISGYNMSNPYNVNMQFPFLFGADWNQIGMIQINKVVFDSILFKFDMSNQSHCYYGELPSCSYHHQQQQSCTFTQPSPAESSCSSALGPSLQSPILGNAAIGTRLNPLAQPSFGAYTRPQIPYDFNAPGAQFMGGAKKSGGRRPREIEMISSYLYREIEGGSMVHHGRYQPLLRTCFQTNILLQGDLDDQDEMEKKLKRRQRNKEAAARCRQRRLDLMSNLQDQVDKYKHENERKGEEIQALKLKMETMERFLRTHDCKMSTDERASLFNTPLSMTRTLPPHIEGISSLSVPVSDYQPQSDRVDRKRTLPAPQLPPTADDMLEPDIKQPKIESDRDKNLAQLNGVESIPHRPSTLDFDGQGMRVSHTIPLSSTPSNFGYQNSTFNSTGPSYTLNSFGSNMGGDMFLNQSTGLTPSGHPSMSFVTSTATPLQNSDADLRAL